MSDETLAHSNKKRYLLAAAGALVFLLILPGIVLAIAANMTGIELIDSYDPDSVPDYDVIRSQAGRGAKTYWIRAKEGATVDAVTMIADHLVRNEKKSLSRIRFYFFVKLDPETKALTEPISDNIDYSLTWNQEDGIKVFFDRSVAGSGGGGGSRRSSAPPFLRGFNPRSR